jgi:small ligand-binding sensory domain FIST
MSVNEPPEIMPPDPLSLPSSPTRQATARSAIGVDPDWEIALEQALAGIGDHKADVSVLFASAAFQEFLPDLSRRAWERGRAMLMIGCSSSGVIGRARELEDTAAISLLSLSLPGATLRPVRFTQGMLEEPEAEADFGKRLGVDPGDINGWLIFADPFRMDAALLVERLNAGYPGLPIVGGLASPGEHQRRTWVFLNGEAYGDGGVGLAIGGSYDVWPVVSQGCEPIGESWTVTSVDDQWVETISNRSALKVLTETVATLPEVLQEDAHKHLVAGLAAHEYRDRFDRGDFLIRNIVGFKRESGAIAIGARPRVGQTIQFQLRDAATADLDLTAMLVETRTQLADRQPVAGLLCSCNGRGISLFGSPNHDAAAVERRLGPLPLAGIVAAGEIGPVGNKIFLHGFTSSLGLIVPRVPQAS